MCVLTARERGRENILWSAEVSFLDDRPDRQTDRQTDRLQVQGNIFLLPTAVMLVTTTIATISRHSLWTFAI